MSQAEVAPLVFADLEVGLTVDGATFTADEETVTAFLAATGGRGLEPGIVPSALAVIYIRAATMQLRPPPGTIYAGQRFRFERPIRIGERLTTTGAVTELFVRNGHRFVVMRTTTTDSTGATVTTGWATRIWPR